MILEMRDICKDYPMGKSVAHILKNVNLDVEEGEYLAIMGPSGSGKTTLMNIIGCLDEPTSGSYLLGGRDITQCTNKQLAEVRNKELGFVFQSFNLLPKLTALENVALPLLYGGVKKAERLERDFPGRFVFLLPKDNVATARAYYEQHSEHIPWKNRETKN